MELRVGTGSSWGWYRADLGVCRDITRCINEHTHVYIYMYVCVFVYAYVCVHIGLGLNPKQRGSHELTGHSLYPPDLKHLPSVK